MPNDVEPNDHNPYEAANYYFNYLKCCFKNRAFSNSVTRFDETFKLFGNFSRDFLVLGKIINHFLENFPVQK